MKRRDVIKGVGATLAAPALISEAAAQGASKFPNKPVTIIMGWPPGSGPDVWHRSLADVMTRILGQPVVVENRAGGGGTIGPAHMAANAKPDGYTIAHIPITVLRFPVMRKVSWDPLKDFSWIVHMSGFQFITGVRADSPLKTKQELIAFAKANPGKLTYASPGSGTSLHIGMELIAKHTGVQFTHVPFKGSIESVAALEGGHVMAMAGGSEAYPMVKAGNIRALAAWTDKRLASLPDVPTLREVGLPFVFDSPYGMAGPKGMDPAIVKILHDAIKKAMEDPKTIEVRNRFNMQDRYMDTTTYARFNAELYEKEKAYLTSIGLARKD
ncbi:MAG: tripartite tricarboxylate transporter substrate binding protein [Hyphomicrobiaceae bacterium]|nr:tripartite tricarboxylate transporter substrate binding protein [Hyphomicrobiaceae bacterium]